MVSEPVPSFATPYPPWTPLVLGTLVAAALYGGLLSRDRDAAAELTLDTFSSAPPRARVAREAKDEARADLAAGEPRWLTFGYPSPERDDFAEILRERHGVELEAIAGCVVDDSILIRAAAYDAVVERWLDARHGRGAVDRAWADAEQRWRSETRPGPHPEIQAALDALLADPAPTP